jgi:hypothetical protein
VCIWKEENGIIICLVYIICICDFFSTLFPTSFNPFSPSALQTDEGCNVFQHMLGVGVKPNATTYSLLADVHIVNRDPKAALAVIDQMVSPNGHSKNAFFHEYYFPPSILKCLVQIDAGFTPSKDTLRKVRRRCSRESDFDSDEKVQSLAKQFNYRMGGENRRELLYNLQYNAEY